ncbi:hypothetical protein SAMN05421812_12641 [Asanoa hainanensis]|uniref:Secreted protein n=1 Tax=Asanoa hainanensis TaxID=560556 RepID=A0A239PFJ8_9ACTN|nr:hypothetical protein [Asanoa hainanensis]SNT65770.1 hypothetical protein SAMN05421812_12641 [Asanoa hainanensis]
MRRTLAVPLLVLGLGLAACDSAGATPGVASAGGGAPSASAAAPSGDEERGRAFAACMREHGVDMPDPQPGSKLGIELDKLDKDKVLDAVDACRDLMPGGGKDVKLNPDQLERQRALAECMRANGVPDFPDPDPDGGAAVREYILDKHDADVLAALETCRDVVPTPSGGVRR